MITTKISKSLSPDQIKKLHAKYITELAKEIDNYIELVRLRDQMALPYNYED